MADNKFADSTEIIAYVIKRGYATEPVSDDAGMIVGFKLIGPRGNKKIIGINDDGLLSLLHVKFWCDGVDYATASMTARRGTHRGALRHLRSFRA